MFEKILKNCRYAYAKISSKFQEDNFFLEAQKKKFLKFGVSKKIIRRKITRK